MDCAPPGVSLFDVLPPCDAPWQMDLPQFLEHVGSSGGGVDVLLLNYGVTAAVQQPLIYIHRVCSDGSVQVLTPTARTIPRLCAKWWLQVQQQSRHATAPPFGKRLTS